ncbi:hypothetical protein LTS18_003344 [Coniosporium uncinatum]|uniref:Uncharacterized protein n=1 Tax=Coniosporium uncinatum TaxID=93489 RepID=A0ACC3DY76_9PEZI|nr:hypothetical protein LTS18_003344 [Coniosporium uncinatum]
MRTSRIAQDSARLIGSLSSTGRPLRSTRAKKLQGFAPGASTTASPQQRDQVGEEFYLESDSDLSTAPSSPQESNDVAHTAILNGDRKRKRNSEIATTNKNTVVEETVTTRTSPREKDPEVAKGSAKTKKTRRQPAKKIKLPDGVDKVEPPINWEEVYESTQEMRREVIAPVDTMGCESLAEPTQPRKVQRFQTLVALMLSSQTKDTVTAVAMKRLQEELRGGLTVQAILAVEPTLLNTLIGKVGFHNVKTKNIKRVAQILADDFDSDIPPTIDGLTSLPGVGPKMAYLCMSSAWGRDEGIGVDVHVHRITNLWGWHKTNTPEETRASLEAWLPREKWHNINHLLVGFGQTICTPVGRKCGECTLAEKGLCPSAVVAKTVKKRVKKEAVTDADAGTDMIVKEEKVATVGEVEVEDVENRAPIGDIEDLLSAST